jgi:hypothetical protein
MRIGLSKASAIANADFGVGSHLRQKSSDTTSSLQSHQVSSGKKKMGD